MQKSLLELRSALFPAVAADDTQFVSHLIDEGIDLNVRAMRNSTVLHWNLSAQMAQLLLDKGQCISFLKEKNEEGLTPLEVAISGGRPKLDLINILLDHHVKDRKFDINAPLNRNLPLLSQACGYNNSALVDCFLKKGADINIQNDRGFTPLHCALICNTPTQDFIKNLVIKGADVTLQDYMGRTPLHFAQIQVNQELSYDITKILLAAAFKSR